MKLAISSDHRGYMLKKKLLDLLKKDNIECEDFGVYENTSADYPIYAIKVAEAVFKKEYDFGIVICGTGIGASISANKVKGIRAALVNDINDAKLARKHNNANVISLAANKLKSKKAFKLIKAFITTEFEAGRHQKRLDLIEQYENNIKVD